MPRLPPIVCFAAPSGTGKTTLIEGVVRALVARNYRVGVLKSDAHRLTLDTPGKDSWRFREAGAYAALVVGGDALGLFAATAGRPSLVSLVDRYMSDVDIVLGEGFRRSGLPSIRVTREGAPSDSDWDPPQNLVAWASDGPVSTSLPVLPIADPSRRGSLDRGDVAHRSAAASRDHLRSGGRRGGIARLPGARS